MVLLFLLALLFLAHLHWGSTTTQLLTGSDWHTLTCIALQPCQPCQPPRITWRFCTGPSAHYSPPTPADLETCCHSSVKGTGPSEGTRPPRPPSVRAQMPGPLEPECRCDLTWADKAQGYLFCHAIEMDCSFHSCGFSPFCLLRNHRCSSVWNFWAFLNRGHSQQLRPCPAFEWAHFVDRVLYSHERVWNHPSYLNYPAATSVPVPASTPRSRGRQWWVLSRPASLEMKRKA